MDLTERDDALYAAFKAKDTRFDGRFSWGSPPPESTAAPSAGRGRPSGQAVPSFPPQLKRNRRATGLACCAARSLRREILLWTPHRI